MSNLNVVNLFDDMDSNKINSFNNEIDSNLRVVTNYNKVDR